MVMPFKDIFLQFSNVIARVVSVQIISTPSAIIEMSDRFFKYKCCWFWGVTRYDPGGIFIVLLPLAISLLMNPCRSKSLPLFFPPWDWH